uniref:F-box protein AT5G49610-like beta-propeller domain-containing protein n=1 Tax=Aegilops tauschii TaxID=37682 RepID=M8ATU8_AEGTA
MATDLGGVALWRLGVQCAEMDSRRRRMLSGVMVESMAERLGKVSKVLDYDNLLREIIIRVGFPTTLVHAALVCKRWYHHASEPAFLRLFHERHPPRLLSFYLENRKDYNMASIHFIPMLPQPPELSTVIRTVQSYSWGFYHGAPANFRCSRKGRVIVSLYNLVNDNNFTSRVHSPLCPERGLVVVPPLPHIQIQDDYYYSMNDLLLVEEADGVSYFHVLLVANMQRTKYTVHGEGSLFTFPPCLLVSAFFLTTLQRPSSTTAVDLCHCIDNGRCINLNRPDFVRAPPLFHSSGSLANKTHLSLKAEK